MNAIFTTQIPDIYMDTNGSAKVGDKVAAAMLLYLMDAFGNPSSGHWASDKAKACIARARQSVAGLIGTHIGDATETFDAFNDGSFKKLLEENSVEFDAKMTADGYSFLPKWLHRR